MHRPPEGQISRRALLRAGAASLCAGTLAACSEVEARPRSIKWGRDLCEHCHMTFGDRRYVAQVWDRALNRPRIYDDVGCAVLATAERGLIEADDVIFWVSDETAPDSWLNARTARYRKDVATPMGYGYAAGSTPGYSIDFRQTAAAIIEKAACEHRG